MHQFNGFQYLLLFPPTNGNNSGLVTVTFKLTVLFKLISIYIEGFAVIQQKGDCDTEREREREKGICDTK
jgi:hypothetical protein